MDITQFYQTFFEEADELLAQMEQLLVDLDIDAPEKEHLNAIFRAAHSIKGGAATFGFGRTGTIAAPAWIAVGAGAAVVPAAAVAAARGTACRRSPP